MNTYKQAAFPCNILCQGRLVNITGDVLLASGVVAYLGAFDARYRKTMISDWQVTMALAIVIIC